MRASRAEDGCISYALMADPIEPGRVAPLRALGEPGGAGGAPRAARLGPASGERHRVLGVEVLRYDDREVGPLRLTRSSGAGGRSAPRSRRACADETVRLAMMSSQRRVRRGTPGSDAEPFVSLYRRFRPSRLSEIRGQPHVVQALRGAVAEGRVVPRVSVQRPPGNGQDLGGPGTGQGPQLRQPEQRRALRRVRVLRRASPRAPRSTSGSSTRPRTTGSTPCATSSRMRRWRLRGAGSSTSSTRSTCSRRRPPTRC